MKKLRNCQPTCPGDGALIHRWRWTWHVQRHVAMINCAFCCDTSCQIVDDHFSGPCSALGPRSVCVCVHTSEMTVTFDPDIRRGGSSWPRSNSSVKVIGQSSRLGLGLSCTLPSETVHYCWRPVANEIGLKSSENFVLNNRTYRTVIFAMLSSER